MIYIARRLFTYNLGFFLLCIGVVFSSHCNIGVSPVGSIPLSISKTWHIDLGFCSSLVMLCYIAITMIILGRKYKFINFFQFIPAILEGIFIFFEERLLIDVIGIPSTPETYLGCLLYMLISLPFIGFGVFLIIRSRLLNLPADAVFVAIHQKWGLKISTSKIIFDYSATIIATIIFLIFNIDDIGQIREGTIISAFAVGKIIGFIAKHFDKKLSNWLGNPN